MQFLVTSSYLIFQFNKFISECSILDRWVTLHIKNSRQNREGKMPLSYTVFACVGCRTICKQSKWLIYLDCWNTKNLSLSCSVIISPSFFFHFFLRSPSMLIICIPKKTQKNKTPHPDVWHRGLKESLQENYKQCKSYKSYTWKIVMLSLKAFVRLFLWKVLNFLF